LSGVDAMYIVTMIIGPFIASVLRGVNCWMIVRLVSTDARWR